MKPQQQRASSFWDDLYREVRGFKQSLPDDAQAKQRGFSILYSPPRPGQILLLGLNPSRDSAKYGKRNPQSEVGPPQTHLYTEARGGKLADNLRRLSDSNVVDAQSGDVIWRTIVAGNKANLLFFGSKGLGEWNSKHFWGAGGDSLRVHVERECGEWLKAIFHQLKPRAVLCEGLSSFDRLKRLNFVSIREGRTIMRPSQPGSRLLIEGSMVFRDQQIPFLGGAGATLQDIRPHLSRFQPFGVARDATGSVSGAS